MAIRDWPRPLRMAIGYGLFTLAVAIFLGSAILLFTLVTAAAMTGRVSAPWSSALVLYSVPVTAVVAAGCAWGAFEIVGKKSRKVMPHFVMATAVGVIVGLLMIPLTGGVSLVCAPAVAPVTTMLVLILTEKYRRPGGNISSTTPTKDS